jgi:acetyl esterase/lipase
MRKILPFALLIAPAFSQLSPTATWAIHTANEYQMYPNVTYLTMGDTQLKMDIYRRRTATTPQPTIIYMHGGFWVAGNKEAAILNVLPWMEMGWNVVNVEYRLGPNTLAPGAVEDCFCALRYIAQQAQAMTYNVDVSRIVVTGESAGGHLALALGILPESEGFDRECAANGPMPKVPPCSTGSASPTSPMSSMAPTGVPRPSAGSGACPTAWKSPGAFHR